MSVLIQPFSDKTLGEFLREAFDGEHGEFNSFQAAVAFAKKSGIQHIEEKMKAFVDSGKSARVIVGIDQQGTSAEGLEGLLVALGELGTLLINHDENAFVTFHPKIYFFEGAEKALLIIGSGNFTQGGMYTNDEGFAIVELDPDSKNDRHTIEQIKGSFDRWCDDSFGTVKSVDTDFLEILKESGYITSEYLTSREPDGEPDQDDSGETERHTRLFGRGAGRRRPPRSSGTGARRRRRTITITGPVSGEPEPEPSAGFIMTLMRTDVGIGQTTPGRSRRSPEIFIPLAARDANTEFWGWRDTFTEDTSHPGKFDRHGVRIRLGGEVIRVNMMTWPVKHDFRLRSEALRSSGEIGDLIRIEKTVGSEYFDYYVEIIPQGTSDYDYYKDFCTNAVRNSERRWGYY